MRTIDADAALKALRKCQTYLYDARDPELKIELSSAEAAINNLPTIQPVATDANVGDTISRQWLMECVNEGWIKFDTEKDENRFIHLVRDIAPSAQPEPRWIPVSERLPETEEFVLASLTGKYRNTTFEHACEIADYADGEWCVYAYPHMSAEKCEELIEAWMPLPEAYKPNK